MKKLMNLKITTQLGYQIEFLEAVNNMNTDIFDFLFYANNDLREESFTCQQFYNAYVAVLRVRGRVPPSVHDSALTHSITQTTEELDSILITIDDGRDMRWLDVLPQLDDFIHIILKKGIPISEQEYFNRHQKIYRIAVEDDLYIHDAAVSTPSCSVKNTWRADTKMTTNTTNTNKREPVRLLNPITEEYVTLEVVTIAPWARKGNEISCTEANGPLNTRIDRDIRNFLASVESNAGRKYQDAEDDFRRHTRDDLLTSWEYVTLRMKIKEIIERPVIAAVKYWYWEDEENTTVKNAYGRQVILRNVKKYAHWDIYEILRRNVPLPEDPSGERPQLVMPLQEWFDRYGTLPQLVMSPQEWFDRHNEIYQVAYNRKFKFVK